MSCPARDEIANFCGVSRETLAQLDQYVALVVKWNARINLVSRSSLQIIWERHILDSAQLLTISGVTAGRWVDLGSGAGFPALVLAILSAGMGYEIEFFMVESDARKAAFLKAVLRDIPVFASVINERIESLEPLNAKIVSARALAPLENLLDYAHGHLGLNGQAIFPKGRRGEKELEEARKKWRFTVQNYPSKTDPKANILKIGDLERA